MLLNNFFSSLILFYQFAHPDPAAYDNTSGSGGVRTPTPAEEEERRLNEKERIEAIQTAENVLAQLLQREPENELFIGYGEVGAHCTIQLRILYHIIIVRLTTCKCKPIRVKFIIRTSIFYNEKH